MYLMIDNYDSFVYNLVSYFMEEGCNVKVIRCEEMDEAEILSLIFRKELKGIIISPGPKGPEDYPQIMEVLDLASTGYLTGADLKGDYTTASKLSELGITADTSITLTVGSSAAYTAPVVGTDDRSIASTSMLLKIRRHRPVIFR